MGHLAITTVRGVVRVRKVAGCGREERGGVLSTSLACRGNGFSVISDSLYTHLVSRTRGSVEAGELRGGAGDLNGENQVSIGTAAVPRREGINLEGRDVVRHERSEVPAVRTGVSSYVDVGQTRTRTGDRKSVV